MSSCCFFSTFNEVCIWKKKFSGNSFSSVACQCIWIGKIGSGWTAKFFQAHINAFEWEKFRSKVAGWLNFSCCLNFENSSHFPPWISAVAFLVGKLKTICLHHIFLVNFSSQGHDKFKKIKKWKKFSLFLRTP